MIVGVDRFPEPGYKVGESVGEKPKTFFLRVEFGLNF